MRFPLILKLSLSSCSTVLQILKKYSDSRIFVYMLVSPDFSSSDVFDDVFDDDDIFTTKNTDTILF